LDDMVKLERTTRFELAHTGWKPDALPLSYIRAPALSSAGEFVGAADRT
jgi:hypothetical protein